MQKLSLKELAIPMIKAIDSFNFLLKSHHRRTAIICYYIGKELKLSDDDLLHLVVSAALHDIGALSVQERDMLVREDVTNPTPHCLMGCRMLISFDVFKRIGQVIKHHHIKYEESLSMEDGEVDFVSHIIHLADRVDILISPDDFILNQKNSVVNKIQDNVSTVFHPEVFEAFVNTSKNDIFWIEINDLDMDTLFSKINFSIDFDFTIDTMLEFALTISRIIDFRSSFTASHSYTVANLSLLIGQYMGLPEEKCKKLMIAGYLHDIGKIGIDPGLIEKKGPLTDEEFSLVKLHTYYTGQILSELSSFEWFSEIVQWSERHHEKVDGSGYPYAIEGESLDIGVKILAFSDIISALMENRPYREGLSIDTTLGILKDKMAKSISLEVLNEIEKHKSEINDLVLKCHAHNNRVYDLKVVM